MYPKRASLHPVNALEDWGVQEGESFSRVGKRQRSSVKRVWPSSPVKLSEIEAKSQINSRAQFFWFKRFILDHLYTIWFCDKNFRPKSGQIFGERSKSQLLRDLLLSY